MKSNENCKIIKNNFNFFFLTPKAVSLRLILFILLSLIFLISCSEEPIFDNLFDPDNPLNPMQGGIEINQISDSKVQLWWQKNDDVKGNYRIERKVGNENYTIRETVGADTTTFIDTALTINTLYKYRIFGVNDQNETEPITSDSIKTTFEGFEAFGIEQQDIFTAKLIWLHYCNYEEGYIIERREVAQSYKLVTNVTQVSSLANKYIKLKLQKSQITKTRDVQQENQNSNVILNPITIIEETQKGKDYFVVIDTLPANTFSYIDNNLEPNNTYEYRIKAFSQYNESDYNTTEYLNTFPAPTDLQYERLTISSIELIWDDNSNGEDGFKIDKKVGTNAWQNEFSSLAENIEEWTDENAEINEILQYRVYAFSVNNYSTSEETGEIDNTFPAPTNLNCIAINVDQIELEWTDNCIGEDGFIIEQKENGGNFIEIETTSQSNYFVSNCSFDSDYIFRVKAFSGNNFSDYSNEFSINIKQVVSPANLLGNISLINNIEIQWTDNCTFETGFIIQRKMEGGEFQTIHINSVNDTTYIDTTGEPLTSYFYRVASVCVDNQSEWSNEIEFLTYPEINIVVDCNGTGDYLTIQEGIDAASNGDIVIVTEGTYNESDIDFSGKGITVASLFIIAQDISYISQTIVKGSSYGGVFSFNSGEDSNTILCGFTITNGSNYPSGGGIYCEDSSPNLLYLTISDNYAQEWGGGIYCSNSSPSLYNITIMGNTSERGGGICCTNNSNPSLDNVKIRCNNTPWIYGSGGGIYCYYSNPTLTNVIISENQTSWYDRTGGGMYCYHSNPSLTNVIITGNSASYGGGIFCEEDSNPVLMSCIFWDNYSEEIYFSQENDPNSITISYSDIEGGESGIVTNSNGTVYWQTGNIGVNPLFISSGDFHLQSSSPCIDTGNPATQYNDPDGSRNDMGAYGGPGGDW